MMIRLVILSWVLISFIVAEMQQYTTESDDLQRIVQSVKKDVDEHLQLMSNRWKLTNVGEYSNEAATNFFNHAKEKDADKHAKVSTYDHPEEISEYLSDYYYGSVKGRPGVNFPDYTDIPITSFTCSDKVKIPGFYADMDTGCQVFHVCWPDRRESFLCPIGTIFNQPISTCDYWYNSNCSLAYSYYSMSSELETSGSKSENFPVQKTYSSKGRDPASFVMFFVSDLMPVKAKIVVYPKSDEKRPKIVLSASAGETKKARKKTRLSKHPRIRRSLEYTTSSPESLEYTTSSTESLEYTTSSPESLHKLKNKIAYYRSWEFLNNAVVELQNNETTSHLTPYTESILKFLKDWFLMDETPEMVNVEPGSELEKYDVDFQKKAPFLQFLFGKFLEFVAGFLYDLDFKEIKSEELNHEIFLEDELRSLKVEPLTNLNSRFIVKPTATEKQDEPSTLVNSRVKRASATLNPSCEGETNIYPETKAALIKNYVKLFKAKHV